MLLDTNIRHNICSK